MKNLGRSTVAAFAVMCLVVLADVITGPDAVLIGALSLGPLIASLGASRRTTIAAAVTAVAIAVPLGLVDGIFGSTDHLIRMGIVSLAGLIAVQASQQRERRELISRQLLHVVEVAQEVMLRPAPRKIAHVALAAHYVSASDLANVGGDLYETAYTPFGVRLVIGDVRGKGLEAVRLAATVLAAFRESVWEPDLVTVARHLNDQVVKAAAEEEFVTALVVEIPAGGGLSLVNLGHHPPLRLTSAGLEELQKEPPTVPLGMDPEPRVDSFAFDIGERLLLFTDGLVEARNTAGDFFPVQDFANVLRVADLQQAVKELVAELLHHVPGSLSDDMALLLAERLPVD